MAVTKNRTCLQMQNKTVAELWVIALDPDNKGVQGLALLISEIITKLMKWRCNHNKQNTLHCIDYAIFS